MKIDLYNVVYHIIHLALMSYFSNVLSIILGTLVTMDDLQEYNVVKDKPVSVSLGNLTLYTLTAPSGGPVLALILKILSGKLAYYCIYCLGTLLSAHQNVILSIALL